MTRMVLSGVLCVAAIAIGIATAVIASKNRARAGDLDRRQRRCETVLRQNDLVRAQVDRDEWSLLHGDEWLEASTVAASHVPDFEH